MKAMILILGLAMFPGLAHSVTGSVEQCDTRRTELDAQIASRSIVENADGSASITLKVRMVFANRSPQPQYLVTKAISIVGIDIFDAGNEGHDEPIRFSRRHRPSISGSGKWKEIGDDIALNGSSSTYLTLMDAQNSFELERSYIIQIPNERNAKYSGDASWIQIKVAKSPQFHFLVQTWHTEIRSSGLAGEDFLNAFTEKHADGRALVSCDLKSRDVRLFVDDE